MALIFLLLSAIAVAVVLGSLGVRDRWVVTMAGVLVAAPAAYLPAR